MGRTRRPWEGKKLKVLIEYGKVSVRIHSVMYYGDRAFTRRAMGIALLCDTPNFFYKQQNISNVSLDYEKAKQ